ncbi:hypothetical protein Tco_1120244 [Tanacetum coccineum]
MACSVPHTDDEIQALVQKLIDEDMIRQKEKYNYRSQTHIGGSSSQTHKIGDVYLTKKELHQLHLDEEALKEALEEARDEKEREEKIRQKQADDELFMLEFGVKYDSEYESD